MTKKRIQQLLLIALLLSAGIASASTKTATGNADCSSATNWSPSQPVAGDNIVTAGFAVTCTGLTVGSKAAGVGAGVAVSVSGGKFQCSVGGTMTFRGFDTTTNPFWSTVAGATMDLSNCTTVFYDGPSDYGSVAINNGNYIDSATTVSDAAASTFVWSNAATQTVSGQSAFAWDKDNGIYGMKLGSDAAGTDAGPISNAANTAVGSDTDNSVACSTGGFDSNGGTTCTKKSGCIQGGVLTTILTTNGDYCVDPKIRFLWYKSSSQVVTVKLTYKTGSWFGWGIWSTNNADNSAITLNGTYSHGGSTAVSSEGSGMTIFVDDKCAPGYVTAPCNATRTVTFGPSFKCEYFSRCVSLTNDHLVAGADAIHPYTMTSPTFNYGAYASTSGFQTGIIQISSITNLTITSPVLNSYLNFFDTASSARGPFDHIITTGACGGASLGNILYLPVPATATDSAFKSNNNCINKLSSFNDGDFEGSAGDSAFITHGGTAGHVNTYTDLYVSHPYRAARLQMYTDLERDSFPDANHHSLIIYQFGYVDCSTITVKNNITFGFVDNTNFPGGIVVGTNGASWVDGCNFSNNTFNGSTRSFEFNDQETTVNSITRFTAYNNIASNNSDGFFRASPSATSNVTNLGISLEDWNDDYNNTTNPTNVLQGTFVFGGVNYNTSVSKTALGVYIFNPSYTLPQGTGKSIVMVVGSAIPTKTLTVQWGGGTAVNMIQAQGTFTTVATSTGDCPTTACATLTDSGASFPTSSGALGLQAYLGKIESGTGSGQYFMIYGNTGTALRVFANTATGAFAVTPDNTSKYLIFKPDQRVLDSGAVDGISVQIYPPELATANGTYTDANITITKNYPGTSGADNGVNPNYVSAGTGNFIPTNSLLCRTSNTGGTIGALPCTASVQSGIGGKSTISGKTVIR